MMQEFGKALTFKTKKELNAAVLNAKLLGYKWRAGRRTVKGKKEYVLIYWK